MNNNSGKIFILQDLAIIFLSIVLAIVLLKTGVLVKLLTSIQGLELFGSFVAGMFFTSVFTTAPAMVTLGEITLTNSILLTVLFGAAGAVVGDLIIFYFIRDRFYEHLLSLAKYKETIEKIKSLFQLRFFRWLTFLVGGLIIASPLPDELGISLLGFSKMKTSRFILFAFTFNFIGILLIGLVAKALI